MTLSAYPEYKDSGVGWLGRIPKHWNCKRLGYFFEERREKVSDKDFPPLSVTKNGIVPQLETAAKTDDGDNRKRVCSGDFVINSRSDRKGSSGKSSLDGSVSLINTVLKPYQDIDINFAHHLFRSYLFQEEFYRYGKGIVADLWSTNFSEMRNIVLAIPEKNEQKRIAEFLDHETTKIVALIKEQEKLIELLKEKRQAVISNAVCRGLDPNVPMKESGVEWLGMVPEHWEIKKLKFLTKRISSGKTPKGGAEIYSNIGVTFLRSQNVYDEGLILDDVVKIPFHIDEEMSSTRVKGGDILLNITGASIGRSCVVPIDFENANVNQHVCVIRLIDLRVISYIGLFMKSNPIKNQINFSQNGAAREGLNFEQIGNLKICIPDFLEQQKIVKYVEMEVQKIDSLHSQITNAIELLKERRSSLISAAVTGQIDVRGFCGN